MIATVLLDLHPIKHEAAPATAIARLLRHRMNWWVRFCVDKFSGPARSKIRFAERHEYSVNFREFARKVPLNVAAWTAHWHIEDINYATQSAASVPLLLRLLPDFGMNRTGFAGG
jgi:hypothetical protein